MVHLRLAGSSSGQRQRGAKGASVMSVLCMSLDKKRIAMGRPLGP